MCTKLRDGLMCSGGTIESFASKLGLPSANLDVEQLESGEAKRAATLGRLLGVQLGVLLGSTTRLGGWGCWPFRAQVVAARGEAQRSEGGQY